MVNLVALQQHRKIDPLHDGDRGDRLRGKRVLAGDVPRRTALHIAQHQHAIGVLSGAGQRAGEILSEAFNAGLLAERHGEDMR